MSVGGFVFNGNSFHSNSFQDKSAFLKEVRFFIYIDVEEEFDLQYYESLI